MGKILDLQALAPILSYRATPVQEILDDRLVRASVRLFVKREDLNHPLVMGNKWWKLKYNLVEAVRQKHKTVLTFGGAFSNHIYATAAAALELKIKSIGIIRGEETVRLNPTLHAASTMGMELQYISREAYRNKTSADGIERLHDRFGDFYLIPEGGSNELAVRGIAEFARGLGAGYDYFCCPVGTGGTLAGMVRGQRGASHVIGFSVLKGGNFLREEVSSLHPGYSNWEIITDYHFGGYGKSTPALQSFINDFKITQGIPLEFVYTGKMFAGIFDLLEKGYFANGTKILAIHTGGIQTAAE